MLTFFRKARGSVSLILILVLLPIVTYATMIVDATRISSAKTAVSGAGDLTMNTALSGYDQALKDSYGLFAMCKDLDELKETFELYFSNTLSGQISNLGGNSVSRDYIDAMTKSVSNELFGNGDFNSAEFVNHLSMDMQELTVKGNSSSTLANPAVMKRQIVEYMKYKAPIMFVSDIMDKLQGFKGADKQTNAVNAQIEYTETLETLQENLEDARKKIDAYNEAVLALDKVTGGQGLTFIENKLGGNGSAVYTDLENATKYLLLYKNLWPYWNGDDAIPTTSEFLSWKNNVVLAELPVFDTPPKGKKENLTTAMLQDVEGNPLSLQPQHNISAILDPLNNEITENSKTTKVWENSYNYSHGQSVMNAIGAIYRCDTFRKDNWSVYQEKIHNIEKDIKAISGKKDAEYVTAFHSIIEKYDMDEIVTSAAINSEYTSVLADYVMEESFLRNRLMGQKDLILKCYNFSEDRFPTVDEVNSLELTADEMNKLYICQAAYDTLQNLYGEDVTISSSDISIKNVTLYEPSISNFDTTISTAIGRCERIRDGYLTKANTEFTNANNEVNTFKAQLDAVKIKSSEVSSSVGNVYTAAKGSNDKCQNWGKEIAKTPEGGTKDKMSSKQQAEQDNIDLTEVEALKKAGEAQKKAYDDLVSCLKGITYFGKSVYDANFSGNQFVSGKGTSGIWTNGNYNTLTICETNEASAAAQAKTAMGSAYLHADGVSSEIKNAVTLGSEFIQFGFVSDKMPDSVANKVEMKDSYQRFLKDKKAQNFYKVLVNMTNNAASKKEENKQEITKQQDAINQAKKDAGDDGKSNNLVKAQTGIITDSANLNVALAQIQSVSSSNKGKDLSVGISSDDLTGQNLDGAAGDSKKEKTKKQKEMLKSSSNFMSNIANLGDKAVSYAFLEEYFANMFSCYTTNKEGNDQEKTLANIPLCPENNVYFGKEWEYLTWGGDPDSAVTKTMLTIYGIRFALNTIYAFTSGEVQSIANAIALAIAGWTGFGVPIVQAIVTVVLALAESGIDLSELSEGKEVPLYKSSSTWRCSISGAIKYGGTKVANTVIDGASDFLSDLASENIDNLSENATNYVNNTIDQTVSDMKDVLGSSLTSDILQNVSEDIDKLPPNVVENSVTSAIDNLTKTVTSKTDSTIVKEAEKIALAELKKNAVKSDLVQKLNTKVNSVISNAQQINSLYANVQTEISKAIDEFVESKLKAPIEKFIKEKGTKLEDAVKDGIDKAGNKLKDGAKDKIETALSDFTGVSSDSSSSVDPKDKKGLSLTYKHYVKIFMLVALATDNEDAMLQRCAALIQVNMAKTQDDENYNLAKAYTLAEVDADVKLRTIFSYDADISGSDGDSEDSGIYSGLDALWQNSGESTLHYHSVMGY